MAILLNIAFRMCKSVLTKPLSTAISSELSGRELLRYLSQITLLYGTSVGGLRSVPTYSLNNGNCFAYHRGDRLSEHIFFARQFEVTETQIFETVLSLGDVAIDVGANVGYFSALFSSRVGPQGVVFALEPGATAFGRLQETVSSLGLQNVSALAAAAFHRNGRLFLSLVPEGHDAQRSIQTGQDIAPRHVEPVEAITIDSLLKRNMIDPQKVRVVKIDIEGGEALALQGALNLLNASKKTIFLLEHNLEAMRRQNVTTEDLLTRLSRYDLFFRELVWPPMLDRSTPFRPLGAKVPNECNLLALPRTREGFDAYQQIRQLGLVVST